MMGISMINEAANINKRRGTFIPDSRVNSKSNSIALLINVPYCTRTVDNQELVTHGPVLALLYS